MLSKIKKSLAVSLLYLGLVGCGSLMQRTPPPQVTLPPNEIERQLLKAATAIEASLLHLAHQEQQNNPPVINTAALITPEGGMGHTQDIDWSGPIAPLLNKIAQMTQYRLKVLGNPPAISININITKNQAVIADILKDAALQAGNRAHVVVFPESKVIELRYATT